MMIKNFLFNFKNDDSFAMDSQSKAGLVWAFIFILLVFVWGGLAQISGAVIAEGRIINETNIKRIQHREGGIIREILVKEGDIVKTGQLLARLDTTVVKANKTSVTEQTYQLSARLSRLIAERDGQTPQKILIEANMPQEFQKILQSERNLMQTRKSMRQQKKAQLNQQITQAKQEINGLNGQLYEFKNQSKLVNNELAGLREVYNQGYASLTRLNQTEREASQIQGQISQTISSIAQTNAKIAQIQSAILQVDSEYLSEVMADLKDTETKLAQLKEQEITAEDAAKRLEIIAPVSGKVQQLNVHTIGGVVSSGEAIMQIVPNEDDLIIDTKIDPQKIDDVAIGSKAYLRFVAFNTQTTPEAIGNVDTLSSDIETDEKTGIAFYRARIKLDKVKIPNNIRNKLMAGQPVEVQIETTKRSALSYFLKPLLDQIARTFKD